MSELCYPIVRSVLVNYVLTRDFLGEITTMPSDFLVEDAKLEELNGANYGLRRIVDDFRKAVWDKVRDCSSEIVKISKLIKIPLGIREVPVQISNEIVEYQKNVFENLNEFVKDVEEVCEKHKYRAAIFKGVQLLLNKQLHNNLTLKDGMLGENVNFLELFVNKDLINIPQFSEHGNKIFEFFRDLSLSLSDEFDWENYREFMAKEFKEDRVWELNNVFPELARQYGAFFNEGMRIMLNVVNGLKDRLGVYAFDKITEAVFRSNLFFEIYCFRKMVDNGLVAVPRLESKSEGFEMDTLLLFNEREACVVEVTTRKSMNEKMNKLDRAAKYLKSFFSRVGILLVCEDGAEQGTTLSFVDLNDRTKVLSEISSSLLMQEISAS